MKRRVSLFPLAFLSLLLMACNGLVRQPEMGSHYGEPAIVVPLPMPPGKAEMVPDAPRSGMVWLDGEWLWKGGRWQWLDGRWEKPQKNSYWAPGTTVTLADGRVVWLRGAWRPKKKSAEK